MRSFFVSKHTFFAENKRTTQGGFCKQNLLRYLAKILLFLCVLNLSRMFIRFSSFACVLVFCLGIASVGAGCSQSSAAGVGGDRASRISVNAAGGGNAVTIHVRSIDASARTVYNLKQARRTSLQLAGAKLAQRVLLPKIRDAVGQMFFIANEQNSQELKDIINSLSAGQGTEASSVEKLRKPAGVDADTFIVFQQMYGQVHGWLAQWRNAVMVEEHSAGMFTELQGAIQAGLLRAGASSDDIERILASLSSGTV